MLNVKRSDTGRGLCVRVRATTEATSRQKTADYLIKRLLLVVVLSHSAIGVRSRRDVDSHPLALPGAETTSVPPPVGGRLPSVGGGVPVPRARVPTPNSGAHGTRKQNAIQ